MSVSILDARVKLAAVLGFDSEIEYVVHDNLVDAVQPPCMIVSWRTPMIDTWMKCNAFGHLTVTLVGGRVDAGSGVEVIERMYDVVQRNLRADGDGWTVRSDGGIVVIAIGGVQYLACRVEVRVPIEVS